METLKKVVLIATAVLMGLALMISPVLIYREVKLSESREKAEATLNQIAKDMATKTDVAVLPTKTDVAAVGTKVDGVGMAVGALSKPIADLTTIASTGATQAALANSKLDLVRNDLADLNKKTDAAVKTLDAVKDRVDHNGALLWGLKTSEARVAEAVKNLNVAEFEIK